jgi:uncharacterized membrane protein HdeD (DUF308 family)
MVLSKYQERQKGQLGDFIYLIVILGLILMIAAVIVGGFWYMITKGLTKVIGILFMVIGIFLSVLLLEQTKHLLVGILLIIIGIILIIIG